MAVPAHPMDNVQLDTEKHYKKDRNYYGLLWDGILFFIASNISAPATVLTAFARELGASSLIVSITPSLTTIGWLLPQLLGASYVEKLDRTKPYILVTGGLQRSMWLVLALLIVAFRGASSTALLWIFLGCVFISSLFDGISTAGWTDFVGRTIPDRKRGSLFAVRSLISGFLGLGSGWISGTVLAKAGFPYNFAYLFLLSFLFYAASWSAFALITVEPRNKQPQPFTSFKTYWQSIPKVLTDDKPFLSFIIAMTLLTLGTMALAFYTVAALDRLGLPASYAGQFTVVMTTGQIFATLFCGKLADQCGHKINLLLSTILCGISVLLPLLYSTLNLYRVAFLLLGASTALTGVSRLNIAMEYAPESRQATYTGIVNTWLAPITLFAPAIGGWLAESFGYNAAFFGAFVANLAATLWFLLLVEDPRKRRWRASQEPAGVTESAACS